MRIWSAQSTQKCFLEETYPVLERLDELAILHLLCLQHRLVLGLKIDLLLLQLEEDGLNIGHLLEMGDFPNCKFRAQVEIVLENLVWLQVI